MNFFKNNKKSGFTLMEIAIAVMIVALLISICLPVVNDQLAKGKQYSYYLAYKTVEKLGGQIVALGDPLLASDDAHLNVAKNDNDNSLKIVANKMGQKIKFFLATTGSKLAFSETYLFKMLAPRSHAEELSSDVFSWDSTDYEEINLNYRICSGEQIVKDEAYTDESGVEHPAVYYTTNDIGGCDGYTTSGPNSRQNDVIYSFFDTNYCLLGSDETAVSNFLSTAANYVKQKGNAGNAKTFCESWSYVRGKCQRTDSDNSNIRYTVNYNSNTIPGYVDDEGVSWPAETIGTCTIKKLETINSSDVEDDDEWARPTVDSNVCSSSSGYYNMTNKGAPYNINCQCNDQFPIFSFNNERVCCKVCEKSSEVAYATVNNTCMCCSGDFNPNFSGSGQAGKCCPEHSIYNGSECSCVDGYTMKNPGTVDEYCQLSGCASGRFDPVNKVCVTNPPIVSAKRLCELTKDNWNVDTFNCNTWTDVNDVKYYKSVFEAATGTNNHFLSVKSKDGAFNNIRPNIVFANGLKLWILSDKSASIPGLSYNPTSVTPSQNVCRNMEKTTKEDCRDATAGKGYFCKSENHCYLMDDTSLAELGDARNCCAATDLGNLASKDPGNYEKDNRAFAINGFTVFVDIDGGNKGPGTLWDDVFPFYLSSNGTVYPAYPLDGIKAENTKSSSLYSGGNSATNLPTDVYYYETDEATNNTRKKIMAYPAVSYARAVCSAKLVNSHTPYCMNLGDKFNEKYTDATNPCNTHKCFIRVRNKLRFF